ncbi:inositol monophosphatase family protein, partial [Lactobacillus sp. XV13L]|nr:inositol monophosphatase family protein [Lactobacillus sp. XV13L]
MTNLNEIKQQILTVLITVKNQLRQNYHFEQVNTKTNRNDLVTDRDISIEKTVVRFLKEHFPQAQIVSEEGYGNHPQNLKGLVFFVDPIDGTMNFVKCHDQFASMIGVYEDAQPIFGAIVDVMQDKIYYGGPEIGAFIDQQPLKKLDDLPLNKVLITISNRLLQNDAVT